MLLPHSIPPIPLPRAQELIYSRCKLAVLVCEAPRNSAFVRFAASVPQQALPRRACTTASAREARDLEGNCIAESANTALSSCQPTRGSVRPDVARRLPPSASHAYIYG